MGAIYSICEVATMYAIILGIKDHNPTLLALGIVWAFCLVCFELQRMKDKTKEKQRLEEANKRRYERK